MGGYSDSRHHDFSSPLTTFHPFAKDFWPTGITKPVASCCPGRPERDARSKSCLCVGPMAGTSRNQGNKAAERYLTASVRLKAHLKSRGVGGGQADPAESNCGSRLLVRLFGVKSAGQPSKSPGQRVCIGCAVEPGQDLPGPARVPPAFPPVGGGAGWVPGSGGERPAATSAMQWS